MSKDMETMKTSLDSRKRRHNGRRSSVGRAAVCTTVRRRFESGPDLQGRICPIVARSGNLLIYPKLTAGKDRPPGLIHARRLYGTVAQRAESLHRRTQRSPVRVRPVPPSPKPCVVHGSGLMPCPDGSIRLTHTSITPRIGTPERRGRGGRNPATSPKAEQCALRVG